MSNVRIQDLTAGVSLNQNSLIEVERYVSAGVYVSERYTIAQLETLIETDLGPFVTRSGTFSLNRLMMSNASTGITTSDITYDGSTTYTIGSNKNLALNVGAVIRSSVAGGAQIAWGTGSELTPGYRVIISTDGGSGASGWVDVNDKTATFAHYYEGNAGGVTIQAGTTNPFRILLDAFSAVAEIFPDEGGSVRQINLGGANDNLAIAPDTTFQGTVTLAADATSAMQAVTYQQLQAWHTGLWDDRGTFDASGGSYPSTGGSGTAGAILKGDIWTISVAGTLPTGQVVEPGDTVRALVDTPGNTQANWAIAQGNLGYTPLSNVLNNGYVFVGDGSNVAVGVAMSGDVTINGSGVTTLGTSISKNITGVWSFVSEKFSIKNGSFAHTFKSLASSDQTWTLPDTGNQTFASQAYADALVADALNNGTTTIAPSQNKVYDALNTHESTWQTLAYAPAFHIAANVTAADIYWHNALGQASFRQGVAASNPPVFKYLKSADFSSSIGLTPKLRLKVHLMSVNDVAPARTLVVGLYPCSGPASGTTGGAGVRAYAAGTVVTGSEITFTTPAADTFTTDQTTASFAFPADGLYAIGCSINGALAANSGVHIIVELQYRFE